MVFSDIFIVYLVLFSILLKLTLFLLLNDEYIREYHEFRLYRLILQLNILTHSCSSELISMFEPSTWQSHIYPKIENR